MSWCFFFFLIATIIIWKCFSEVWEHFFNRFEDSLSSCAYNFGTAIHLKLTAIHLQLNVDTMIRVQTPDLLIAVYSQVASYPNSLFTALNCRHKSFNWLKLCDFFFFFLPSPSVSLCLPPPPLILEIWGKTTWGQHKKTRRTHFFGTPRYGPCNGEENHLPHKSTYHHKSIFNFTGGLQQSYKHLLPAFLVYCSLNRLGPRFS